jgi:NitT/TauT family transport system permease protein
LNRLFRYAPLLILALAWEFIARTGLISSSALPPLTNVLVSWWGLMRDGDIWTHGAASLWRVGAGLFCAIVIGGLLGVAMASWKIADTVLAPFVSIFYPLPKSALIPITALWLGFGDGSKILLIALGCMLPVTIGAYNGARSADRMLVWSARGMGASKLRMLRDVVLPSALPELLSGVRTAMAISFVLLIASELVVARAGFGYLIGFLGSNGTYEPMFAVVLTVAFLGFVADRLYMAMTRRVFAWRE